MDIVIPSDPITATAKAVESLAKLGEKSLDVMQRGGAFVADVLKGPIDETAGMIHDHLRFVRWARLVEMESKVQAILTARGVTHTRAVAPKLALPLLEQSSLEEDSELTKLWAGLLANAMDPGFEAELRYGFVDMVKALTALDAKLLFELYDSVFNVADFKGKRLDEVSFPKSAITESLEIDEETYYVSIYNLMRVQCVAGALIETPSMTFGPHANTIYKGADEVVLTPLGAQLVEACTGRIRAKSQTLTIP